MAQSSHPGNPETPHGHSKSFVRISGTLVQFHRNLYAVSEPARHLPGFRSALRTVIADTAFSPMMCLCHVCPRLSTRPGTIGPVNEGPKDSFFRENPTILRVFATPTGISHGWRYAVSGSNPAQGFSRCDRFRVNDEFQKCGST